MRFFLRRTSLISLNHVYAGTLHHAVKASPSQHRSQHCSEVLLAKSICRMQRALHLSVVSCLASRSVGTRSRLSATELGPRCAFLPFSTMHRHGMVPLVTLFLAPTPTTETKNVQNGHMGPAPFSVQSTYNAHGNLHNWHLRKRTVHTPLAPLSLL